MRLESEKMAAITEKANREALEQQTKDLKKAEAERLKILQAREKTEQNDLNKVQRDRERQLNRDVKSDANYWSDFEKFGQKSKSGREKQEARDAKDAARKQAEAARLAGQQRLQQSRDQSQWDLILGGGGRTGTAGMKGPTKGDVADPFGMAGYQKNQQHDRRQREQAEKREQRDAELALGRQREQYHRLGESITSTTDAVTRLGEGMAYLGLIGQRDLGRLTDSLLMIRGTVDTVRGGVGAMRDVGGLMRNLHSVGQTGGAGAIGRAFLGMGPAAGAGASGVAGAARAIAPLVGAGAGSAGVAGATGGGVAAAAAVPVGMIAAAAASIAAALGSAALTIREAVAVGGFGKGARVGGAVDRIASTEVGVGTSIASGFLSAAGAGAGAATPYGLGPRQSERFRERAMQSVAENPVMDMLSFGLMRNAMHNRTTERKERYAAEDKAERDAQSERYQKEADRQRQIRNLDREQDQMRIGETFRSRVGVSQLGNLGIGRGGIDAQLSLARQEKAALAADYKQESGLGDAQSGQKVKLSPERQFEYDQRRLEINKQIYEMESKRRDLARQELDLARNRYELGRNEKSAFTRMNPIEQQRVMDVYRRGKSGEQLHENDIRLLEGSGISRFGEIAANQRDKRFDAMFKGTAAEKEDIVGQGGFQAQEQRRIDRERKAIGPKLYEDADREIETPMRPTENAEEGQKQRRDQWRQEFQQATANLKVENVVQIEAGESLSEIVDQKWNQFLENQNKRFDELIKSMDEKQDQRLAATRSRINQQGRMLA
jgi:hypothetical protein